MNPAIRVEALCKTFTLHTQGGIRIPVFQDLDLEVHPGECLALHGPSGSGKSSLLRSLYANYKPQSGSILIRHLGDYVDMLSAPLPKILEVRRTTLGYVSQFLRVIPRISALDIVAEPLTGRGVSREHARQEAATLLERLRIPRRLWPLAPATFSGGEQQRINLARGFIARYPIMLLDEPTSALDSANRNTVLELIEEAKNRGAALVGIFHDDDVRNRIADRWFDMKVEPFPNASKLPIERQARRES